MKASVVLQCLAIGVFGATTAHAATVWDEAQNGDLSGNGLAPTTLTVAPGSNVVNGTTGDHGQGVDRDYFKFTVPTGSTVTAIKLLPNTSVSGGVSFIGIQPGPQLTVTPSGGGASVLIAQGHYGNDQINTDLLPQIRLASTPIPLPSGTYSVWVQDTGGPADYGLDFVLSSPPIAAAAAPSLSGWGLLLLGTLLGTIVCILGSRAVRQVA
jgi:hypothetical protein